MREWNRRRAGRIGGRIGLVALVIMLLDVSRWESVDPWVLGWVPYGFWWPLLVTAVAGPVLNYFFRHHWPEVPVDLIRAEPWNGPSDRSPLSDDASIGANVPVEGADNSGDVIGEGDYA